MLRTMAAILHPQEEKWEARLWIYLEFEKGRLVDTWGSRWRYTLQSTGVRGSLLTSVRTGILEVWKDGPLSKVFAT